MENNENKAKKQRIIIAALILGMMFCIGITIWAVFFRKPETKSLVPDYAPQQTEQNAEPLEDNSRSLDVPEGGGGISLEYENTVNIKLSDKTAYFSYKHPSSSTQDIVLCIEVNGEIIARSGTIKPGNQLKTLPLLEGEADKLSEGTYTEANIRVVSYDPQSGEKAMVDTVAKITVTVEK